MLSSDGWIYILYALLYGMAAVVGWSHAAARLKRWTAGQWQFPQGMLMVVVVLVAVQSSREGSIEYLAWTPGAMIPVRHWAVFSWVVKWKRLDDW